MKSRFRMTSLPPSLTTRIRSRSPVAPPLSYWPLLILVVILFTLVDGDLKTDQGQKLRDPRNEIHHHQSGEDEYYDEGLNYHDDPDDPPQQPLWGESFTQNDTNEISAIEREEELEVDAVYGHNHRKPRISKCCDFGEGLNSQGQCKKLTASEIHLHRHTHWFPDRVIDFEINNWTVPNETDWEVSAPSPTECHGAGSPEVIYDTNLFVIVSNGKLFLPQHSKDIGPGEYCLDLLVGKGRAVRGCFTKDELCRSADCLRKCCPEGTMVEESSGSCYYHSSTSKNRFPNDKYNVIHGAPTCPFGQYKTPINGYFNIGADGSLHTSTALNVSFLNYCLDFFIERPTGVRIDKRRRSVVPPRGSLPSASSRDNELKFDVEKIEDSPVGENEEPSKSLPILKAIMCFDSPTDAIAKKRNSAGLISVPREMSIAYGVAFVLSSICIALAAFISWRLPELRSLHGKCQLSHLATLFALFVLLAITHLGSESLVDYTGFCTFLAVSLHTTTLSAFLWLNLLCVNIYLTFRSLRPPLAARRDENKRLFFLCFYAWGIPVSFCIFLFLLDRTPGRLEPMPRPEYGINTCLISNRTAMFYYFYGPVGFLLMLNGVLFGLTARELLCGLWRLDNSDSISFRRKSMGIVVAKLGIVMGLGWILDVLSWAVGKNPYIFYIADLFNGLQGVFMFLVLIWRKRVLEVLKLRKPSLIKDETLTARPFLLPSKSQLNTSAQNDPDTSLILNQQDA